MVLCCITLSFKSHAKPSITGIVSAPLWDSHSSTFAGLLTTSDYINVVQYYWQNPDALNQIDQFRLSSLRGRLHKLCCLDDAKFLTRHRKGYWGLTAGDALRSSDETSL